MAMIFASINQSKESPACRTVYLSGGCNVILPNSNCLPTLALCLNMVKFCWFFLWNLTCVLINGVHYHQLHQSITHLLPILATPRGCFSTTLAWFSLRTQLTHQSKPKPSSTSLHSQPMLFGTAHQRHPLPPGRPPPHWLTDIDMQHAHRLTFWHPYRAHWW